MGFKSNFEEVQQGGLKPEGDYECIITAIEDRTNKNGKRGLNFTLVIRNDVEGQKYGNACLFHTIWQKIEPTPYDMQVEGFNFNQLMSMGRAARLPDGKEYDSLKAYCEDLLKKCVRVTVYHEEYNGKTQERISWVNETHFPECKHKFKTDKPKSGGFVQPSAKTGSIAEQFEDVIDDDDGVPF